MWNGFAGLVPGGLNGQQGWRSPDDEPGEIQTDGFRMWTPAHSDADAVHDSAMTGMDKSALITFQATFQCPDNYQPGTFGVTWPQFIWNLGGNTAEFMKISVDYEDYAVHPNQATVTITDAGNPNAPSARFNVHPGAWNTIKVLITTSNFTVFVNNANVYAGPNDDPQTWDDDSVETCLYVKPLFQEQLTGGLILRGTTP